MNKRHFLHAMTMLCTAATCRAVLAQTAPAGRLPRVGILWHAASAEAEGPYFKGMIEGLRQLGYEDKKNIILEHRFPDEVPERFASMAAELVALKVDVLIGVGANSSQYAKDATSTIPVVFLYVPDPVRSKLVQSLARPGGNATGLSNYAAELTGLRMQLLKEFVPNLSRVALLVNPNAQISTLYVEEAQRASAKLGLTLRVFEARALRDLDNAFAAMSAARMQGLFINAEGLFFVGREAIAKLALAHKLPLCVWSRETVEAGALLGYGPDQIAICRRAAVYVDKILKGVKAGEIPVEQPTKFDLLINGSTARALGLRIPHTLQIRSNGVI